MPPVMKAMRQMLRLCVFTFIATWLYAFLKLWIPLVWMWFSSASAFISLGPQAMAASAVGGAKALGASACNTFPATASAIATKLPAIKAAAPLLAAPAGIASIAWCALQFGSSGFWFVFTLPGRGFAFASQYLVEFALGLRSRPWLCVCVCARASAYSVVILSQRSLQTPKTLAICH